MTTTAELTEDAHAAAVEAAVDLLRTKHPDLDLRAGTAVRALVVEPGAVLDASMRDVVNRLRTALSLNAMAREATVPREDAEAVLSNFGVALGGGTKATGRVRVNLVAVAPVTLRAGVFFTSEDGISFVVTETVSAAFEPAAGEERIRAAEDGSFYFTVPVEAVEVGANGNIRQGHALSTTAMVANYDSAEAWSDFSGGEDGESVAAAVARIPSALSSRGMTNALSVRARFAASLPDPSVLRAVSCVGHRDRAMLRDKHNPLGLAVGGRVDVYARLFDAPGVVSFEVTGTLDHVETDEDGTGVYRIVLPAYPGFSAVKFVGPADQPDRQGSLQYELIRTAVEGATNDHDFDTSSDTCEIAWSAYQGAELLVRDSSDYGSHVVTAAATERPATKAFKVDLFWTDGIRALQSLVDDPAVRNVAADYVVRAPALCLVSMTADVRLRPGVAVTARGLAEAVEAYINTRSFTDRLTRSELANILLQNGAESVDLSAGGMYLGGRVCGADGRWYFTEGDALDLTDLGPDRAMVTPGTTVFASEPGSVQITIAA